MNQHSNWITSSYSNAEGNCVEADGPWRTSSHSDAAGNQCVEAAGPWHTSSYSGTMETCVEVSESAVVRVRDTKDRERGQLAVSGAAWTAFLGGVTA